MKSKEIVLPIGIDYQDESFLTFAISYVIKTSCKITFLVNHTFESSTNQSAKINNLKEKIHLKILKLNGLLNTHLLQWPKLNHLKMKVVYKYGKVEDVIMDYVSKNDNCVFLLKAEHYAFKEMCQQLKQTLIPNSFQIVFVSTLVESYQLHQYQDHKLSQIQTNVLYDEIISQSTIYNYPMDFSLV